jgi:hypothetical protein
MRIGTLLSMPNEYTRFARIKDQDGMSYTVDPGDLPKNIEEGDDVAYKVDIWENDSGLAYKVEKD